MNEQLEKNYTDEKVYLNYADFFVAKNDLNGAVAILEAGRLVCNETTEIEKKLYEINNSDAMETLKQQEAEQKQKEEEEKKKQEEEEKKRKAEEAEKKRQEEEKRKQEEAEAERKRKEEDALYKEQHKAEFIASCQTIAYKVLARNPDTFKGQNFTFTGEVKQVVEYSESDIVDIRINVTVDKYGYYDDTIFCQVSLPTGSSRILEDDIITIYGRCCGLVSYENVLGSTVSLPGIYIEYYQIQ